MNLYWSIYEALEEETLSLADNIMFNDNQLDVYSVKLGNLIVRSAMEIEAISKELYCCLGGESKIFDKEKNQERYPYFDTECLDLLVRKWKIDKKKIQIVSSKMYFTEKKNFILTPLHKANRSHDRGSRWNKAYQALKHNRTQNMEKATVRNLLNALGALYILNLYYRDDVFWQNVPIEGNEEYRTHSRIFSPFIYEVPGTILSSETLKARTDTPFDECIYLKKYTEKSAMEIRNLMYSYNFDIWLQTITSDEFVEHGHKHVNEQSKINTPELIKKLNLDFGKMVKNVRVSNIPPEVYRSKEIVLNKCQQIYPPYTYEDFLETPRAKKMQEDRIQELNRRLQSS